MNLEEVRHIPDASAGFSITQGSLELAASRGTSMSVSTTDGGLVIDLWNVHKQITHGQTFR